MQFRVAKQPDAATALRSPGPNGRLESDSLLLPLQPGRILSVKQSHQSPPSASKLKGPTTNQRPSDVTDRGSKRQSVIRPEPIDYIRLRRTDGSVRAAQRNRSQHVVAHEILQPSTSLPTALSPTKQQAKSPLKQQSLVDQRAAVQHMDHVLEEIKRRVLSGKDDTQDGTSSDRDQAALLAGELQQLYRQQSQVEKEATMATQRVQQILTSVRNDISVMYKFTPLFKIYARHKSKSAWLRWRQYVLWHREEEAQLALLWPYAVTIQRVFRQKRYRWQLARQRMAIAWGYWQASIVIQRLARAWLSRRERQRLAENREAAKMQAVWRGRRDRKWVKKLLQDQLRTMLRLISPTGNLHRLGEFVHKHPELAQPLNWMLSLVEETHVVVDASTVYKAKNARIAAKIAARPVEASRKELFHAVLELSSIIASREQAVAQAKQLYAEKRAQKQLWRQQEDARVQAQRLLEVQEKLQAQQEMQKMNNEELWMREYLRMLKTADADRILRKKLDQQRREAAENAKMVVEEYQMRYFVSETRRRQEEDEKRLGEVERRQQFLREQEHVQTQQLMDMLKTDEMKRREVLTKRQLAKAAEQQLWSQMSKEQQEEAMRRLQLKKQVEEEEMQRIRALTDAQQAHERELVRRREESRSQKQLELAKELAAREAMEREEKESRRVHFEWKKAVHAETWKAKREKELVRYSLDPMHYAKVQALKEMEERERWERYLMRKEDELTAAIHEEERRERYFALCRERRMQEKADSRRAEKERALMDTEDQLSSQMRAAERRALEYQRTLAQMATLAFQNEQKKQQQLWEAKNRKLMFEEEMRQHRAELVMKSFFEAKENHERDLMAREEQWRCAYDAKLLKRANKRFREKCILEMLKEDVTSMRRQDVEVEGRRLEKLLWEPDVIAALTHLVVEHSEFLAVNVTLMKDLGGCRGLPPFDLDYEAVHRHRREEGQLSPEKVPRKKRKPRKFFYHEFFEEDPILAKYKRPDDAAPTPAQLKARERWRLVARHFLSQTWTNDAVREAYLLMSRHRFGDASRAFTRAVHLELSSPLARNKSPSLFRQAARCCVKEWEQYLQRKWLEKSLFYFHAAGAHLGMLTNPRFLQEIAFALERLGRYREAAQVLSGVIACFPRYTKLNEVVFRGGVVLMMLQCYQQSREYLMHTLDTAPFGWEAPDILTLAARVMQLEGKPRRKLCAVAYEEAFRTNKRDAYYRIHATWKDWLKASATWRELGDRYYAKQEFALARDAYQVMMKRIVKMKAITHGVRTRQHVMEAARRASLQDKTLSEIDDGDWLRVAKCAAVMGDRESTASAMRRWLAQRSYRERVLDQFYSWPLARWKLLGVEVPERVIEALEHRKQEVLAAEQAKLKAIQEKRQLVLKQRSIKARERCIAWASEDPATQNPSHPVTTETNDANNQGSG